MCKTIFMLTLVSFVAQPLQGMNKSRTINYDIPSQTQQLINQEKLVLGGALAAGAALVYWLYRSNYKSSLKEASDSLLASQEEFTRIALNYTPHSPLHKTLASLESREGASDLYRSIERNKDAVAEMIRETKKHQTAWEGYRDYRHADAKKLIENAEILKANIKSFEEKLDHHIAQFVFSASTTEEITQLALQYRSDDYPALDITDLANARTYQAELISNTKKVAAYAQDLTTYCTNYMSHPNNQVVRAQHLMRDARAIQENMDTIQHSLTQRIAQFEVNELYFSIDDAYRNQINLIWFQDQLEASIKVVHNKDQYPLLAYLAKVETARDNLRKQAARIPDDFTESSHARALADELDTLMKTVVNIPAYDVQKTNKQKADATLAERQQKERLAREEIEARERLAQKNRESQERIARQDREAKVRTDQAMIEEQRRIARAKEQEAIAAREKSAAEERKARAEEERVRIDRERLRLEQMRAARERLAGKPQGSTTQQDDHLL